MKFFKPIEEKIPEWLSNENKFSDIIISTRARVARNIKGYPYYKKINSEKRKEISKLINRSIKKMDDLSKNIILINLNFLDNKAKKFLRERFLATDFMMKGEDKEIISEKKERFAILVNEEDHLRIQAIAGGLNIKKVYKNISTIEKELEKFIDFDFTEEFGYLTACPTNTGTGLRISVMMHLPALFHNKMIKPLFSSLSEMGLSIRGFYGEGSESLGCMFQISNQYTMGFSEEEIIHKMEKIIEKIYNMEKEERIKIAKKDKNFIKAIEDDFELINYIDSLSIEEATDIISKIRLGISLKLIDSIKFSTLNKLLILIQPMHLLYLYNIDIKQFNKVSEKSLRATIIRKYISSSVKNRVK